MRSTRLARPVRANNQPHAPPALLQLRHPNVVGFAGVTFHGSKGVVLMELCEGALLHHGAPSQLCLHTTCLCMLQAATCSRAACHAPPAHRPHQPAMAAPPLQPCTGRDLHSALQVLAAGSQERLFGWHRRGKRVALDIAKVGTLGQPMPIRVAASHALPCLACGVLLLT